MFSFPPQPESDQQTRNWYQELLDHPECQDNPEKVQEAYESYRQAGLTRSVTTLTACNGLAPRGKITPSPALIQYLYHVAENAHDKNHVVKVADCEPLYDNEDVNCMVIWARPRRKIVCLLLGLQDKLKAVVGSDMWFPEPARLHLSVLELSHRHSMAHLRSVYDQIGVSLVRQLLDYPVVLAKNGKAARLGRPMLMFDGVGVAVGFVPVRTDPYTYHHLRRDLYNLAIRSGIKIDTCYTACTGHITLGRFVSTKSFDSEDEKSVQTRIQAWVDTIQSINQELKENCWTNEWEWAVGEETGLEIQMGMLKFGRDIDAAEMVGKSSGEPAMS